MRIYRPSVVKINGFPVYGVDYANIYTESDPAYDEESQDVLVVEICVEIAGDMIWDDAIGLVIDRDDAEVYIQWSERGNKGSDTKMLSKTMHCESMRITTSCDTIEGNEVHYTSTEVKFVAMK